MSLRLAALTSLAASIDDALKLPKPTTVVDAPPGEAAVYPAAAVLLDRHEIYFTYEPISVDAQGAPQVGARASLTPGPVSRPTNDTSLIKVATLYGHGRIWIGARHPAKREELEHQVLELFTQESTAPGMLYCQLTDVRIGAVALPFPWTIGISLADTSWSDEHVFGERLWSYCRFDVDVDMLIARSEPLLKQFILELSTNNDIAIETHSVDSQGIIPYP